MSWRNTSDYRNWRRDVINRDKTCAACGSSDDMHAHHKNHATYFPEQRFDVKNGVAVCIPCHVKFHNDFKRNYRVKCDEADWNNFIALVKYIRSIA